MPKTLTAVDLSSNFVFILPTQKHNIARAFVQN